MSTRKTVYDAVVAAFGYSTGIAYVTRDLEQWWDWGSDRFPAVRVIDKSEELKPFAYLGSTDTQDMEATITMSVSGYVHDLTDQNLPEKRSALITNIQKIMLTSTGIKDVTADVWPIGVDTDEGVIDNFAWCECEFKVRYFYSHAAP